MCVRNYFYIQRDMVFNKKPEMFLATMKEADRFHFTWLSVSMMNVLMFCWLQLTTNDWVGCGGHPQAQTPNIDRLAERVPRMRIASLQYATPRERV